MVLTLSLLVLFAAGYVATLSIRFARARSSAQAAITTLQAEIVEAERCNGYQYGLTYKSPELMFQVICEVKDQLLALQGSMILIDIKTWRQRMDWKAVSDFGDVTSRAEASAKALKDASFFAQFPPGTPMFKDVSLNGIPLRVRESAF